MNILTYVIIAALAAPPVDSTSFVITNFGAVGNKTTLNTSFIQRAIDSCAVSGGGMVVVPAGDFLTGTIYNEVDVYSFANFNNDGVDIDARGRYDHALHL